MVSSLAIFNQLRTEKSLLNFHLNGPTGSETSQATPTGGQTTSTTYDSVYHTYATSVTNPLSQSISTTYDYTVGLPDSVTDQNNNTTSASYDDFGRMTEIRAPGDGTGTATLSIAYSNFGGTSSPYNVRLTQKIDASQTMILSHFYNGLGQLIQTQTANVSISGVGTRNIVVDYDYDDLGRLARQTVPYPITAAAVPTFHSQAFTQALTTTVYDILGRVVSVEAPNGNDVTTTYSDLVVTQTDPKNYTTTTTYDVWGNVVSVDPPSGPSLSYEYDVLGRLLEVQKGTSPNFISTTITYDLLGRKIAMDDPDMGYWEYAYDGVGNLTSQTDERGCEITFGYDGLNRLTSKQFAGTTTGDNCDLTPDVSYSYDAGTNGIGYRTGMSDGSGTTAWTYDNRGRLITESKSFTGVNDPFETSWTYNSADMPVTMTMPDGEVVTYTYDSQGLMTSLTGSDNQSNPATYAQNFGYDVAGRLTTFDYGAALRKTFTYNAWTTSVDGGLLNQTTTQQLSGSQATLQNFVYDYDANSNITSIVNSVAGETSAFTYDNLNQIKYMTVTQGGNSTFTEAFDYDTMGRLLHKGESTTNWEQLYYNASQPHAVSSVGTSQAEYYYDANGSMEQRKLENGDTQYLTYDAENRVIAVDEDLASTPTATATATATATYTATATSSTPMDTPTPTATFTATPTATPTATATPTPTATQPTSSVIFEDGFESTLDHFSPWAVVETDGGDLSAETNAAAIDSYGAQFLIDDTNRMRLFPPGVSNIQEYSVRFYLDPNSLSMDDWEFHYVFYTRYDYDWMQYLEFGYDGWDYYMLLEVVDDSMGYDQTSEITLNDDWNVIEIHWQASSAPGADDGEATLYLNDSLVATLSGLDDDTITIDEFGFGALATISSTTSGTYYMDGIEIRESGYIGMDPNGPSVNSMSSMSVMGSSFPSDLESSSGINAAPIITDDLNGSTDRYRARFYVDPHSINIPAGESLRFYELNDNKGNAVARMQLRYEKETYWLLPEVMDDTGIWHAGMETALVDSWNAVEIDWQAAQEKAGTSGSFQLWVNGNPVGALVGLKNSNLSVSSASLGVLDETKTSAIGRIVFDWYQSGGEEYIGLIEGPVVPTVNITSDASTTPRNKRMVNISKDTYVLSASQHDVQLPMESDSQSPLLTTTTVATYTYDGDGVMVKSVVNGVTTYYIGGYYEYQDDGTNITERKYYSVAGMRVAMRTIVNDTTDTLNWLLGDHLGSTSMVTDASGVMVSEVRYSAFGETRYQSGTLSTDYLYTGQRQETEIGLYYYVARWYDPAIGRFVQADSIVPDPGSALGFDRYAYTNNNPLNYIDPSGHMVDAAGSYNPWNETVRDEEGYTHNLASSGETTISILGGSKGQAYIEEQGPSVKVQLFAYVKELNKLDSVDYTFIYPGNKYLQSINIKKIPVNQPANLICYSAAPEACLMGANASIDSGNRNIQNIVLLGPTFLAGNEQHVVQGYAYWQGYLDKLMKNGVNVLVVHDDSGGSQTKDYVSPGEGVFMQWDLPTKSHFIDVPIGFATNNDPDLVNNIYRWFSNPNFNPYNGE